MFFTPLGYWAQVGGGGVSQGLVHNLLMQFFTSHAQKSKFSKFVYDIVINLNEVVRSKPGRRIYGGKRHIPPILGLFAYPTPRG